MLRRAENAGKDVYRKAEEIVREGMGTGRQTPRDSPP
jgi:hypothetical protein